MSAEGITHTIRAKDGPETVQAQPATPGLYIYEVPENVDKGGPCRWRLGHHSGLLIAAFRTPEDAREAAAAIADWTDWTGDAGELREHHLRTHRDQAALNAFLQLIEDARGHIDNCGAQYDPCR
jgi:hypothetical protein